jgi:putative hemolysin
VNWLEILATISILLGAMASPALSIGLGGSCPTDVRNPAEAYCMQHGGCPKEGYCYFPDGSFCELWAFYNGTCPSEEYYEQMLWEAEAYRFLHGDEGYNVPVYQPYYYPYYYPYYSRYRSPILNRPYYDRP